MTGKRNKRFFLENLRFYFASFCVALVLTLSYSFSWLSALALIGWVCRPTYNLGSGVYGFTFNKITECKRNKMAFNRQQYVLNVGKDTQHA